MAMMPSPTAEAMRAIAPEHSAHLAVFDAKNGVAPGSFQLVELYTAAHQRHHEIGRGAGLHDDSAIGVGAGFAVGQQPGQRRGRAGRQTL